MNSNAIAAVGRRRIERAKRDRREEGRKRDNAIEALKQEHRTAVMKCLELTDALAKMQRERDDAKENLAQLKMAVWAAQNPL